MINIRQLLYFNFQRGIANKKMKNESAFEILECLYWVAMIIQRFAATCGIQKRLSLINANSLVYMTRSTKVANNYLLQLH